MFILYLFIFIFGLVIGSFLNVVIFRLEKGGKMINDRSKCLHCSRILAWYDLVPILSFIFLKGKCRYCGKPISFQYPLVELATGILFVLILDYTLQINELVNYGLQFLLFLFYYLFIAGVLIVIFVYDLKHYIIPDRVIYPTIFVALGFNLLNDFFDNNFRLFNFSISQFHDFSSSNLQFLIFNIQNSQFINYLFAAILAGVFFLSIVILTCGKGMGGGDVKLGFLMGVVLGWPAVMAALFLSFILGSVVGVFLILAGKKKMKSEIPFGPFLVLGTFVAIFWGREIIGWYFGIIG